MKKYILYTLIYSVLFILTNCKKKDLVEPPITDTDSDNSSERIYGLAKFIGGENNLGYIYELKYDGTGFKIIYSFVDSVGFPGSQEIDIGMTKADDGNYYGICYNGANNITGSIFIFNPDSAIYRIVKKLDFSNNSVSTMTQLSKGNDGKLYFMGGRVIRFDPLTNHVDILTTPVWNDYYNPTTRSLISYNGTIYTFYGNTNYASSTNYGGIAKYVLGDPFITPLFELSDSTGYVAVGDWYVAPDSCFYGSCMFGGKYGYGCLVKFDPRIDTLERIHDFDNISGRVPRSSLLPWGNSKLLGTCLSGLSGSAASVEFFSYDIVSKEFEVECQQNLNALPDNTFNLSWASDSIIYFPARNIYSHKSGLHKFNIITKHISHINDYGNGVDYLGSTYYLK